MSLRARLFLLVSLLLVSLVAKLIKLRRSNLSWRRYRRQLINENKWRAVRFGLDGDEPRTLQEIGESLGLSRERIRQIESKAKEKIRRSREAQGLRGYLN